MEAKESGGNVFRFSREKKLFPKDILLVPLYHFHSELSRIPTNCTHYTRRRILATNSSPLKGLVIYISAPCLSPHALSSGVFLLVNKMIGMCRLASMLLNLRHNWKPFCFGKTTSRTMHCGRSRKTFSRASSPSTAVTTSKPLLRSGVAIIVNSVQLSSTTSIFCPGIQL